jgi:hypothetical protein
VFLGALAVLGIAWAQRAETKGAAADEIARLLEKHKGDYLKGDADAWAALYAEDATFIGGQRNLQSRRAIRDSFAQGFKDFPTRTAKLPPVGFPAEQNRQLRQLEKVAHLVRERTHDIELERLFREGDIEGVLQHQRGLLQQLRKLSDGDDGADDD